MMWLCLSSLFRLLLSGICRFHAWLMMIMHNAVCCGLCKSIYFTIWRFAGTVPYSLNSHNKSLHITNKFINGSCCRGKRYPYISNDYFVNAYIYHTVCFIVCLAFLCRIYMYSLAMSYFCFFSRTIRAFPVQNKLKCIYLNCCSKNRNILICFSYSIRIDNVFDVDEYWKSEII